MNKSTHKLLIPVMQIAIEIHKIAQKNANFYFYATTIYSISLPVR